jgi:hypothetical protein
MDDDTDVELFRLNVELAFIAIAKGVDDFTGEPICHAARHQVPRTEMEIRKDLPAVFKAIFSREDAAALKEYEDSLPSNKVRQKKRSVAKK